MTQSQNEPIYRGYDIDFLQSVVNLGNIQAQIEAGRERKYGLLRLKPGLRVLDVGCGPGTDTVRLADWVSSDGQVIGIDRDVAMIEEADRIATESSVTDWVEHRVLDVANMPFEDDYFDRCHGERLFIHLPDPQSAMSEILRVVKPDGWIVLAEPEFISASQDTSEVDVEQRLVRFKADSMGNGYAARQLYRLFKESGLTDVSVAAIPLFVTDLATTRYVFRSDELEPLAVEAGVVTQTDLDRFKAEQETRDAAGVYFAHLSMLMVAGRKP